MGVPTMYVRLLDEPSFDADAAPRACGSSCRVGAAAGDTFRQFEARTGSAILERYGNERDGDARPRTPTDGNRVPARSACRCRACRCASSARRDVANHRARSATSGAAGRTCLGLLAHAREDREDSRADGWFRTGDVGASDANGYLSIVGRMQGPIITGGYNVYPKEIEASRRAGRAWPRAAVIGVPHRDFGEAVVAAVVRAPGRRLDEAAIIAALKGRIAASRCPSGARGGRTAAQRDGQGSENALRERFGDARAGERRTRFVGRRISLETHAWTRFTRRRRAPWPTRRALRCAAGVREAPPNGAPASSCACHRLLATPAFGPDLQPLVCARARRARCMLIKSRTTCRGSHRLGAAQYALDGTPLDGGPPLAVARW
jgi:hypothetical protein